MAEGSPPSRPRGGRGPSLVISVQQTLQRRRRAMGTSHSPSCPKRLFSVQLSSLVRMVQHRLRD